MSDSYYDWRRERYLLDDLPEDQRREVEHELASNPEAKRRLERLRGENAVLRERYDRTWLEARFAARPLDQGAETRSVRPVPHSAWAFPAAVALASMLLGFWFLSPNAPDLSTKGPSYRLKGVAQELIVYRLGSTGPELLMDSSQARAGDRLQLYYRLAETAHGVVFSLDGRGILTWHLPESGDRSLRLEPGSRVRLPHSFELDDAPRGESFCLVTAPEPFAAEAVLSVLPQGEAATLPPRPRLPQGYDMNCVTLDKGADQ